jgi:hypothetical protein
MREFRIAAVLGAVLLGSGCAHQVAFQDIDYQIDEQLRDEQVTAVVSEAERARVVPVRSLMTGAAHSWNAEPGEMLWQVAEVEVPQMFANHRLVEAIPSGSSDFALTLSVPDYRFEEFRAKLVLHALLRGPGGEELLDETYPAEGASRGGRMFWGGAFAMKSAMRTSSIEAFQDAFAALRADLNRVLDAHGQSAQVVIKTD